MQPSVIPFLVSLTLSHRTYYPFSHLISRNLQSNLSVLQLFRIVTGALTVIAMYVREIYINYSRLILFSRRGDFYQPTVFRS